MDSKKKVFVEEIRKVHKDLRKKLREEADFVKVWDAHCQDAETLEKYAQSMQDLAIDVWDEDCDGEHRIEWCRETCRRYFDGEELKKLLQKDERRKKHYQEDKESFICGPNPLSNIVKKDVELNPERSHPKGEKLHLLDVGSCYDPFRPFEEFETIAIDLQPANKNVFKCDFIKVEISSEEDDLQEFRKLSKVSPRKTDEVDLKNITNKSSNTEETPTKSYFESSQTGNHVQDEINMSNSSINDQTPCRCEPEPRSMQISKFPANYFDIVVFSLLLTYIPSPHVRWKLCEKAHKLLATNGLLLIIAPDSSHQNRNAALMKKWKTAIEMIGFQRIEYRKDTHLHFMAFRKVPDDYLWDKRKMETTLGRDFEVNNLVLNIPQDFQEFEDSDPETNYRSTSEDVLDGYCELPLL